MSKKSLRVNASLPLNAILTMKKLNESQLQVGDIILTTTNRPVSIAIRTATKSDISHAMIYVQPYSIIDATRRNVQASNTQRLIYDDNCAMHVLRLRNPLSVEQMKLVTDYARSHIGTQYSVKEAINTVVGDRKVATRKQFCSRLVARAYDCAGVRIVDDVDYCTPEEILSSELFLPVDNAICSVTQTEINAIQDIPDMTKKMHDATNVVMSGVRTINSEIQDFNDLDRFLIEHQEHDQYVASLYNESGYLSIGKEEKAKNFWQYDISLMELCPWDEMLTRKHCEMVVNEYEAIKRTEDKVAGYGRYFETYQLETFRLLHEMYVNFLLQSNTRVEVAQEWLRNHP
jgi:hypothetical protein